MKKKKALKITLSVIAGIVLGLAVILGLVKVGERLFFAPFYFNSTTEFKTPGLSDGLVQQGFDYYEGDPDTEDDDRFLVAGYMAKSTEEKPVASRIYVLNKKGKVLGYTILKTEQKNEETKEVKVVDYAGHCGGIAFDGEYIYVSNDDNDNMSVDVFKLSDILNTDIKETKQLGSVYVYQKPAFCYVADGKLYTGNFHREATRGLAEKGKKEYLSPDKVIALGDDMSDALMTVFELDQAKYADNFGVASEPCEAYAIPSQVQGMCMTENGDVVFSTSWGLSVSKLYFYNLESVKANTKTTATVLKDKELYGDKALEKDIPLYIMGEAELTKTVSAPPMAEEMVCLDGKIYIMNESASNKYIFGRFLSGAYVSAYKVD